MLKTGILNPHVLSLVAHIRHTNTLVIADRGFPFWSQIETVDLSLVDDIPTVLDVLRAILPNFELAKVWMAEEFRDRNADDVRQQFALATGGVAIAFEPHIEFKRRVPQAIGLIRTGDTIHYSNMILESG